MLTQTDALGGLLVQDFKSIAVEDGDDEAGEAGVGESTGQEKANSPQHL